MKTVAFVTQKGGAGKTTLAAFVGVAAQEAGEKVALLDLDPQGSLYWWGNQKREEELPPVDQVGGDDVGRLPEILGALKKRGFTLVILDTAGSDTPITREAMKNADMTLIPTRPSAVDLHSLMETVRTVMRMDRSFRFVLNQCLPRKGVAKNMRASEAASGLTTMGLVAEPMMIARVIHSDAFGSGMGITEFAPNDIAAKEIRQLWSSIKKAME